MMNTLCDAFLSTEDEGYVVEGVHLSPNAFRMIYEEFKALDVDICANVPPGADAAFWGASFYVDDNLADDDFELSFRPSRG